MAGDGVRNGTDDLPNGRGAWKDAKEQRPLGRLRESLERHAEVRCLDTEMGLERPESM
jgi:hypothetical protein